MRSSLITLKSRIRLIVFFFLFSAMLLVSQACSKKTPTPSSTPIIPITTPTSTPQSLPPALVETDPLPGAQIALKNPITFYFNQPMDRSSVEGALSGEPALSGSFTWQDDSSLTFTPDSPLLPGTSLAINVAASAQSSKSPAFGYKYIDSLDGSPDADYPTIMWSDTNIEYLCLGKSAEFYFGNPTEEDIGYFKPGIDALKSLPVLKVTQTVHSRGSMILRNDKSGRIR